MGKSGKPAMAHVPRFVVGIGASAGGLDALQAMLPGLQPSGAVAFVIAQHMAHDGHSDLMARLLNRCSPLSVQVPAEDTPLLADHIYLLPAGHDGEVRRGRIHLKPRSAARLSAPSANVLFASLAEEYGERAVGIVLSGTGSDGTAGCRSIAAHGGITIAQDLASAAYDGMPGAAVRAGCIQHVLSDVALGRQLLGLLQGVKPLAPAGSSEPLVSPVVQEAPERAPLLTTILQRVHDATGVDFAGYKDETLLRRLDQRMRALRLPSPEDYLTYATAHAGEWSRLQQAFLVSLSAFFRNRAAFDELGSRLLPAILDKPEGAAVRIWVPGCASGEEVYSLAILLLEGLGRRVAHYDLQVIGSDLNVEALAHAETGAYRHSVFKEMPPALQARYFQPKGSLLVVEPGVRALCRFEHCDVLGARPAEPLDLVSCRNLLIYLKASLQDHLLRSFHRALLPEGLLLLGDSENLSPVGNTLFATLDYLHRLYRRRQISD